MLDKLKHALARRRPSGASAGPPSRRMLWLRRTVLGVANFLVLFTALGFLAVPPLAKHYLVKSLSDLLGRQVAVEDIDLNPFSMLAVVKGFRVSRCALPKCSCGAIAPAA